MVPEVTADTQVDWLAQVVGLTANTIREENIEGLVVLICPYSIDGLPEGT